MTQTRSPKAALLAVSDYFERKYGIESNIAENATRLKTADFELSEDVVRHTISGETATLEFVANDMNAVAVTETLNTHKHGREYHRRIGQIGLEIGMEYTYMNTIIRKLFDKNFTYSRKILNLEPRLVYSFVLNNADRLRRIVREAMAAELNQMEIDFKNISKTPFRIPRACQFTYDSKAKVQAEMNKNVYQGYLSSAEPRSSAERKFEKFCESSDNVEWVYKNGDKGSEYLSIVYADNSNKLKNFFPDYIVGVHGKIWIIETKGGFDRSGNSQDIDIFTPKKFEVLKSYLERYGLQGGIVRYDESIEELCICIDSYSDNIRDDCWKVLSSIIK